MAYPFDKKVTTNKKTNTKFSPQFIILHHTGGGTFLWNVKYLSEWTAKASVHFVIWPDWETAKIGEPTKDCLRHCGQSVRGSLSWMNKYSLWIEVVGYGEYNIHQLISLTDLTEYLMYHFNIPKENVLRHCDLTWAGSVNKKLRDGKSKSRKVDIWLDFFGWTTDDFIKWREQLIPRQYSRYWNI